MYTNKTINMNVILKKVFLYQLLMGFSFNICLGQKIDREALVKRHNIHLDKISSTELLQVGNGEIAYGIDATGLQTFYGNTMSQWGWHSFPRPVQVESDTLKLKDYDFHGRKLSYRTSDLGQKELYKWMRENPHRINLGRLRFLLKRGDGNLIELKDVKEINQMLDLWHGIIVSQYNVENILVYVESCVDPETGALAIKVKSPLIQKGRLQIEWSFPYSNPGVLSGADWSKSNKHSTKFTSHINKVNVCHEMDSTTYYASLEWNQEATFAITAPHTIVLTPAKQSETFSFVTHYSQKADSLLPSSKVVFKASKKGWENFWCYGGAIDLSGSKDSRWKELERRIVLSQYLLALNEAGSLPPQESGLFNNSGWSGKFHLEMYFWHSAHYALWGRWPLFERSINICQKILPQAIKLANSQGFRGARFPKMIGPDFEDTPSLIGPLLIWQQPHPIFFAELEYRLKPTHKTLEKWKDIIQKTADFMADFAWFDPETKRYVLGPPLQTVPENVDPIQTINPTFELSYWRSGLRIAQMWRERMGLKRESHWDDVLQKLAKLPQSEGVYLQQEGMIDNYTAMNWEHPSLIGPNGMLPSDGVDSATMRRTVEKVWSVWQWDRCWGWDFPMMAMAAAKNGRPDIAIDALLHPSIKNNMNAVGLSTGGPFPYFPSNGGLLYAIAMMASGWDGSPDQYAPGFPQDGTWKVRFEGLSKAP